MIKKRKDMYFTKKVKDELMNLNAHIMMDVHDVSNEGAKAFETWINKVNESQPIKKEDIGIALEYEIHGGNEDQDVRVSFDSYHNEDGLEEKTRKKIEVLMDETALKLERLIQGKE